jgi:hypothetical protein
MSQYLRHDLGASVQISFFEFQVPPDSSAMRPSKHVQ